MPIPIKYFVINGDMRFTPFGNPDETDSFRDYASWTVYLNKHGIYETKQEKDADLYITQRFPINTKKDLYLWRLKHRYIPVLVWTHEPRCCNITHKYFPKRIYKPDIYVMDVFTDDVYLNHYTWFGQCIKSKLDLATENDYYNRSKKICCLGSFRFNSKYYLNNRDIDLVQKRQDIALLGYKLGLVDICGNNWPDVKPIINNRNETNWHQSKIKMLRQYRYNLCIENTNYKYYITEKIWDAITAKCLPIYNGTEYLYEIFPKNSFIDINEYFNYNELLDHIRQMDISEYLSRLNKCIKVYNNAYSNINFKQQELDAIDIAIKAIKKIVNNEDN